MTSGGFRAWFVVLRGYDADEHDEVGRAEYGYVRMAAGTICFSTISAADVPGGRSNRFNMYKFVVCQTGSGWFPSDHLRPWGLDDIAPDGRRREGRGRDTERPVDVAAIGNRTSYPSGAPVIASVDALHVRDHPGVPSPAADAPINGAFVALNPSYDWPED